MWKSSASGAPDNASLSHFSAMTRPSWLDRAATNRHRHAIDGVRRPDLRRVNTIGVLLRADLVQSVVVFVTRLAAANSTHQLHELACVEIKIRAPHAVDATLANPHRNARSDAPMRWQVRRCTYTNSAALHAIDWKA